VTWTVEGEWLKGLPNGVCIVESDRLRGVVTFTRGKAAGGPIWYEDKASGVRVSVEYSGGEEGKARGIKRVYENDKAMAKIDNTGMRMETPGWMKQIE
jgi:hypothetical protein